jgi:hypothetical protein
MPGSFTVNTVPAFLRLATSIRPPWFAVLAASAVTWFVLRSLKRNTSLLQVEGR